MTFFDPAENPGHICDLPESFSGSPHGWICDCGKAYVKRQVSQHGETWWQWYRSPQHDRGS